MRFATKPFWKTHLKMFLGMLTFLLLWLLAFLVFLSLNPPINISVNSFIDFMNKWGGVIGITATIVVAILVAILPSTIDAKVKQIAERLQSPLADFESIYRKSLELLLWLNNEENSSFKMILATPVFGIEFTEQERNRWENALRQRIVTNKAFTSIICRDWQSNKPNETAPILDFCKELETLNVLAKTETKNAYELYLRSIDVFFEYSSFQNYKNFSLKCAPKPPVQVVVATNSKGISKGIIYFTSIASERQGLVVSGFLSEDDEWINLMKEIFNYMEKQSRDVIKEFSHDFRSKEQKDRCYSLLKYQQEHIEPYSVEVEDIRLEVFPGVFPPEYGIGNRLLIKSINEIKKNLKAHGQKLIGVDIGTGTGILAIALASYCDSVYATDIFDLAIKNADKNINDYKKNNNIDSKITTFKGNLLEPLPQNDKKSLYLLVFNYPFYPSPLAVFNPYGKEKAGLEIIREFFSQATIWLENNGIIMMPYTTLGGEHNPTEVAKEYGLKFIELHHEDIPNQRVSVFIFSKNNDLLTSLSIV